MQGPIAQALALTVAGNAVVAGRDVRRFWPDNSVFRWTKTCNFVSEEDAPLFADPGEWLADVAKSGKGVRLHNLAGRKGLANERQSVGFVGGGRRWIIEVIKPTSGELWQGFDRLGDRKDKERKIWNTTYVRQAGTLDHAALGEPSVVGITDRLKPILADICFLAREIGASNFEASFDTALAALDSKSVDEGYLKDVEAIASFDAQARGLFLAAQHAWVFGGMGSWNDMVLEGEQGKRYENLSETLFAALNEAIVAIANSTCSEKIR